MTITEEYKDFSNVEISSKVYTDITNNIFQKYIVEKVKSFDTETKEAEIYSTILYKDLGQEKKETTGIFVYQGKTTSIMKKSPDEEDIKAEIVTFKCHLRGFKAYNIITGEEIK